MTSCESHDYDFYFDEFHNKNGKKCKQCKRSFVEIEKGDWVIVLTQEAIDQYFKEVNGEVKYV